MSGLPNDRDTLTRARLRREHTVGKPCPEKPWMTLTTLDADKGVCGACGRRLGEAAR